MVIEQRRKSSLWSWMFLPILLSALAWALLPAPSVQSDHATSSHLTDAITAMRSCGPNDSAFYNKDTQRAGYICETEDGKWGIVIFCAVTGVVITAFIKNKMKRKDQVERYMENSGYRKM